MKYQKVLLIQPKSPVDTWVDNFPIGLASIAMFLRKHGIEAKVIDLNKQEVPDNYFPALIGIGASTSYAKSAIECSKKMRIKFPGAKIVLGGHHFSALPDEGTPYAEVVVIGEGEKALLEICKNGITEQIIHGELIENLDDIPIFDRDLLDLLYKDRRERLHVVGARGCPFNCTFCAEHRRKIRAHSPECFVDYLQLVSERYSNDIFISDDIFCIDKKRTSKICELILEKKLKLNLQVFGHITMYDHDLYALMKEAGVRTISYGIESGNNEILKNINKKFTVEKAEQIIRKTREMGFNVSLLYMVGNIGETKETISDTIGFSIRNDTGFRWCSCAIPFPGTAFFDNARQNGTVVTDDWNKYINKNIIFIPKGLTAEFLIKSRDTILNPGILDKIKFRFKY